MPPKPALVEPRSSRAARPLILAMGVHLHDVGQCNLQRERHRTGVN